MIRLVHLGSDWYGREIDSVMDDEENITEFVSQANPVIIVESLDYLGKLDILPEEVTMVLDEDE